METFNIAEGRLCETPHLCVQQRGNEQQSCFFGFVELKKEKVN